MKFIKIPKVKKPNLSLTKKTDEEDSNDASSFLDEPEKKSVMKMGLSEMIGSLKKKKETKTEQQIKEEAKEFVEETFNKIQEKQKEEYDEEAIKTATDYHNSLAEDGLDETALEKYERLQNEYAENPSEELSKEISEQQLRVLEEQANQAEELSEKINELPMTVPKENLPAVKIPDSIPDVLNEDELKRLEQVKKEDDLKLAQDQKEKEQILYIQEQRAKGAKKREERKQQKTKDSLEHFPDFINEAEYEQSYTEHIAEEFEKENKIEEPKPELIKQENVKEILEEKTLEPLPEVDLTCPDYVGDEVKKIWHLMNEESKQEIITNHEIEIQQLKEEEKKQLENQKKSIFSRKINFSLKKKQMKKVEADPTIKRTWIEKLLKRHMQKSLKDIEAYCFTCKHTIQAHEYKGKSAGCSECGCLVTVSKILEVSKIKFKVPDEDERMDETGLVCECGHREIVHQDKRFCEEKDCYCIGFKNATQNKDI